MIFNYYTPFFFFVKIDFTRLFDGPIFKSLWRHFTTSDYYITFAAALEYAQGEGCIEVYSTVAKIFDIRINTFDTAILRIKKQEYTILKASMTLMEGITNY